MPFKTILAIIQSARDAERVSDCAGALAARYEAHLIGLHAELACALHLAAVSRRRVYPRRPKIGQTTRALEEDRRPAGIHRRAPAPPWRHCRETSPAKRHSGSQRPPTSSWPPRPDRTARRPMSTPCSTMPAEPVLVIPHDDAPCLASFRRVIVAWNGSREAARAAFDALPFILEAESTEILLIDPPERRPRLSRLAPTLPPRSNAMAPT